MKTAWVFPGQGSQTAGMGLDLLEFSAAKARFDRAAEILGWSVVELCQSVEDRLSQTLYTQPCLYVVEAVLVDMMRIHGHQAALVAGHSLGEYVALYAAKVFDFETGLRLVQRRAELMASTSGGKMVALLGFDRSQLETQLAQTDGVVLANDNNESQVVISGTDEGVEAIVANVKAKRAVSLSVSGAFHSPMMAAASYEFNQLLDDVVFLDAQVPVLSNVDPTPETHADRLKERLQRQMTGQVRWREISLQLSQSGIDQAVEIGPGKVLTGLIKRTSPDIGLVNLSSAADVMGWTG